MSAPPRELIFAQTEDYVEYTRHGKVVRGEEAPVVRSRFEEDIHPGNHSSIWGSYWSEGKWGFKCCHSFVKLSYCTGAAGKDASDAGASLSLPPPTRMEEAEKETGDKKEEATKKKEESSSAESEDEEEKAERLAAAKAKEEKKQKKRDKKKKKKAKKAKKKKKKKRNSSSSESDSDSDSDSEKKSGKDDEDFEAKVAAAMKRQEKEEAHAEMCAWAIGGGFLPPPCACHAHARRCMRT